MAEFQINDVLLDIPPEQISIDRRSMNHSWQTLRTKSSIKLKSGYSQLDISCKVFFTEGANSYRKLRDLVSQFRTTPFCYVESEYLRNAIMHGDTSRNMALALRNMIISKSGNTSSPDIVEVDFYFSWFNYFPYMSDFLFKKEPFLAQSVRNPADSDAWKIMYLAEQKRSKDKDNAPYVLIDKLGVDNIGTKLSFTEFKQLPTAKYQLFKREVKALKRLRSFLQQAGNANDNRDIIPGIYGSLIRDAKGQNILSDKESEALVEEVFGANTSMLENRISGSKMPLDELADLLDQKISSNSKSRFANLDKEWKIVVLDRPGKSKLVTYGSDPTAVEGEETPQSLVIERDHELSIHADTKSDDIILTGISVSFQNILAVLPVRSFAYPTFQHIGSIDAVVSLSFVVNNGKGMRQLTGFYNTIEEQAINGKKIPEGQRNLHLHNDLVNMCGLREFIPENFSADTIPGSPGISNVVITLLNNPITSTTKEDLKDGKHFINNRDILQETSNIIDFNLRLIPNAFIAPNKLRKLKLKTFTSTLAQKSDTLLQKAQKYATDYPSADVGNVITGSFSKVLQVNIESGYFIYSGSNNDRDYRFKQLCIEYGQQLGRALHKLISLSQDYNTGGLANALFTEQFNKLTNQDVFGISLLQDVINPQLQSTKRDEKTLLTTFVQEQNIYIEKTKSRFGIETTKSYSKEEIFKDIISELSDWISWSEQFLTKIISSNDIRLPQLKNIYEEMKILMLQNDITGYPDFPLFEVVSLIEENPKWRKILNDLTDDLTKRVEYQVLQGGITNKTSLIQPDFYLYDNIGDTQISLISPEMIKKSAETVKITHRDHRAQAENDWFRDVYNKEKLGETLAKQVEEERKNVGKGIFDDAVKKMFTDREEANTNQFKLSDLDNGVEGLGPSIAEFSNHPNKEIEPITLPEVLPGNDNNKSGRWFTSMSNSTKLTPVPYWSEARHRFGLEVLDFLGASEYAVSSTQKDIQVDFNVKPKFNYPTGPETRRITSGWSLNRPHPIKVDAKGRPVMRAHHGVDFGSTNRQGSRGHPVYAAADGAITHVSYSPTERAPGQSYGGEGVRIRIRHGQGYETVYMHLLWDDIIETWSNYFWDNNKREILIKQGTRIGSVGDTGGISAGAHLHFEIRKDGTSFDPIEELEGSAQQKYTQLFVDADPQNKSLLTKSVEQLEKGLVNGQGIGLRRAYPTYRLYFIESDINERKRYQFDDFFSYSSVTNIELVRGKDIAADLLIIELTNTSGVLTNRKFRNDAIDPNKARNGKGEIAKEEDSVASLMLQPGTQLQLMLGYSNNINDLSTPFNGVITDVQFMDTEDNIRITCQSFGIQLVQNMHGEVKSYGGWWSKSGITGNILENLMASPELTHFGRWQPGALFDNPDEQAGNLGEFRSLLTTRWTRKPQPADDNIFAPTGRGIWGLFDSSPTFIIYQSTLWDAIQELTLRHPSMIAYPVPYEGLYGPRMTMFFGVPDQPYFARDPTPMEQDTNKILKEVALTAEESLGRDQIQEDIRDSNKTPDAKKVQEAIEVKDPSSIAAATKFWLEQMRHRLALNTGLIRPFRSYHIVNSAQHIIHNNITSSLHDTFNTVTVQYSDNEPEVDANGNARTNFLRFDDAKTHTQKCDGTLPSEEVREFFAQFPNCVGEETAKRYSLSLLKKCMQKGYKGKLTIIGNPEIKPHDIVYVMDQYNDMYGPIEVDQVVTSFNQQTGFVTDITPSMCVHVNEHCTMATQDALGLMAEAWLKKKFGGLVTGGKRGDLAAITGLGLGAAGLFGTTVGTAVGLLAAPVANMFANTSEIGLGLEPSANPLKIFGAFFFSKLITRTQLAHPMRYSPLVQGGYPMLGGIPKQLDVTLIQGIEKAFKDGYRGAKLLISDTLDKLHPNYWLFRGTGDLGATILNEEKKNVNNQ